MIKKKMKPFSNIFLVSIFLFIFHEIQAEDLIHEVCTRITKIERNYVNYNFCKNTLYSTSHRHGRQNMFHLASSMISLVGTKVLETREEIREKFQEKRRWDFYFNQVLNKCHQDYTEAISFLQNAVGNLRSQKYMDARTQVIYAHTKLRACSDAFKVRRLISPFRMKYEDLSKYCRITENILTMIQ